MNLGLVRSFEEFVAVKQEWVHLEERSSSYIFQNADYIAAWYENIGRFIAARFATVIWRDDDTLRAALPLCILRVKGVMLLTWLCCFQMDYGDLLLDRDCLSRAEEFVEQAFRLLKKQVEYDLAYFPCVRRDSPLWSFLQSRRYLQIGEKKAPYAVLEGHFQGFAESLRTLRKNLESDTLRRIRRLSELGELRFSVVDRNGDAGNVLNEILRQKESRYKVKNLWGKRGEERRVKFLLDQVNNNKHAHLSYLSLNGNIIAGHMGYLYKHRFYFLITSFNLDYQKYSPGRIMIYFLMQMCFEHGVRFFDFCRGDEKYKYEWTREEMVLDNFVENSIVGKLVKSVLSVRRNLVIR